MVTVIVGLVCFSIGYATAFAAVLFARQMEEEDEAWMDAEEAAQRLPVRPEGGRGTGVDAKGESND